MKRQAAVAVFLLAMVAVIVGVDVLFLSHHFLARLITNIAIVVAFASAYLLFARRPRG
ncbi:MAG TPA: hypothetical protein VEJ42_06920 [Streptosporangiaceae bacterium]|nr:hypothetical protein [Streptosporangiaceae bacterium]